jgi:hypothetical protein
MDKTYLHGSYLYRDTIAPSNPLHNEAPRLVPSRNPSSLISFLTLHPQPQPICRGIGKALRFAHVPLGGLNTGMSEGGFNLVQLRTAIPG